MQSPEEHKIQLLYIDDEVNNLTGFKANYRREFDVYTAESAAQGRAILEERPIHVLITDHRMPVMTGVEFLQSIKDEHPYPMRILLTGYTDIETVIDAVNKGNIYQYVKKPYDIDDLRMMIKNAYEVFRLRADNEKLTLDLLNANKKLEFLARQSLIS